MDVKKKQQLKKFWRFPLWLELRWKFRPQAEKVAIPSSPLRSVLSLVEKKTWLLGVAPQSWGKTETSNSAANSTGLSSPPEPDQTTAPEAAPTPTMSRWVPSKKEKYGVGTYQSSTLHRS